MRPFDTSGRLADVHQTFLACSAERSGRPVLLIVLQTQIGTAGFLMDILDVVLDDYVAVGVDLHLVGQLMVFVKCRRVQTAWNEIL